MFGQNFASDTHNRQGIFVPCYLCGGPARLKKHADHIPPQGFFPKPHPPDLIKVPCCLPCNNKWAPLDEIMRRFFACADSDSEGRRAIFGQKVEKTLTKSPKLVQELRDRACLVQTVDGAGNKANKLALKLPVQTWTWAERIVKGLIAHHYPQYPHREDHFKHMHWRGTAVQQEVLASLKNKQGAFYDNRGESVFEYCGGIAVEALTPNAQKGPVNGIWIFQIYGALTFMVAHGSELKQTPICGEPA